METKKQKETKHLKIQSTQFKSNRAAFVTVQHFYNHLFCVDVKQNTKTNMKTKCYFTNRIKEKNQTQFIINQRQKRWFLKGN